MFVTKTRGDWHFYGWRRIENFAWFFFFFQLSQEFVFLQQPLITSQIKISIWQEKKKLKCFMDLVILLEQ